MDKILLNLGFVIKNEQILLGNKKRGFGEGKWNGFGGKVKTGEDVDTALNREFFEEAGITPKNPTKVGELDFVYPDKGSIHNVCIYLAGDYEGEVVETEEMYPKWFNLDEIPYENMWVDDSYWFEYLIAKKNFKGEFVFGDEETITDYYLEQF